MVSPPMVTFWRGSWAGHERNLSDPGRNDVSLVETTRRVNTRRGCRPIGRTGLLSFGLTFDTKRRSREQSEPQSPFRRTAPCLQRPVLERDTRPGDLPHRRGLTATAGGVRPGRLRDLDPAGESGREATRRPAHESSNDRPGPGTTLPRAARGVPSPVRDPGPARSRPLVLPRDRRSDVDLAEVRSSPG